MNFWNYIGEFFLFRWLLGKLGGSNNAHKDDRDNAAMEPDDDDELAQAEARSDGRHFFDEQDDSGMPSSSDRPKIFSNSGDDLGRHSLKESRPRYDWNNDNSQSYDDFDEEQDDYDMMDDF